MQFISTTILGLFDSSQKYYEIPVYQRAYSWEEPNWKTFLDDLLEQIQGVNKYFFGTILLEVISKNREYEIIDGQQRITTLSIFMRSMLNVLEERNEKDLLDESFFKEKENIYLVNGGNIKLRPVDYDVECFNTLIIKNQKSFPITTDSQERIKNAKKYFEVELGKLETPKILKILDKTENTELTIIELEGKKDSALMFELENNRGKELTEMEKTKSYFMYQMYVYSPPGEIDENIKSISRNFEFIYKIINGLKKPTEDSVLLYHNHAYINGFDSGALDHVKNLFKKQADKIKWIEWYIAELHTTFSNIKKFEDSNNPFAQRLKDLGVPAYIYPFIIKGYKYEGDEVKLNMLFHLLEIITFRVKLIHSGANIQSRLKGILLSFSDDDFVKLRDEIKTKLEESWYWSDARIKDYLNGYMYDNNVLRHVLWQYEKSIQNKGYSIGKFSIDKEQIEHISPQNPTNGEPTETGYEVDENNQYSDDFRENKLNCIGNLMLISGSHNSSISNDPFSKKLSTYKRNAQFNQQAEIVNFAKDEGGQLVWKSESIDKRKIKIVEFSINNWSFDSINTTKNT